LGTMFAAESRPPNGSAELKLICHEHYKCVNVFGGIII